MPLTVSNTLSGESEVFEPVDPDQVTLYYCGLTVSDDPHLGHARSWVHTDVIHRWLSFLGYDVRHVENFTDINEKIVARIGAAGDDETEVARHYIAQTLQDMRSLNLKRVDVYPRVTEHIPEIIDIIGRLIDRGYAYEAGGSVYFDVTTFEAYGALSNQPLSEMEASDDAAAAEKRHPQDFALWKAGGVDADELAEHSREGSAPATEASRGAATFDSPWSVGRPGWHIECSAMATSHLGETFDIHVAGRDIIFPHNENEIAQAVAATDGEYARYWLHTGLLRTEGEKMSSSLQNFFRVSDAVERFGPNVIRTFMLSSVYSADQTFSEAAIAEAEERWERLRRAYDRGTDAANSEDAGTKATDVQLREAVDRVSREAVDAMNDDFNTREAMAALLTLATDVNRHLDEHTRYDYQGLHAALTCFEEFGGEVFGLELGGSQEGDVRLATELVELLLAVRDRERDAGNYEQADEIREDLASLGVIVEDTDSGTDFRVERR